MEAVVVIIIPLICNQSRGSAVLRNWDSVIIPHFLFSRTTKNMHFDQLKRRLKKIKDQEYNNLHNRSSNRRLHNSFIPFKEEIKRTKKKWVKLLLLLHLGGCRSNEIRNYRKYEFQWNSKGTDILTELRAAIIQIKSLNKFILAKQIRCSWKRSRFNSSKKRKTRKKYILRRYKMIMIMKILIVTATIMR